MKKTQKNQSVLSCAHKTAFAFFLFNCCAFTFIGCSSLFRYTGLSPEQAAIQEAALQEALANATTAAIADIKTGLEEGHDLKTIAVKTSSAFLWKILTAAGASIGVVLNTLLAKWLNTERKITATIIRGVEKNGDSAVKKSIQAKAKSAGIETQLNARVLALT